jgi:hypothetical protein
MLFKDIEEQDPIKRELKNFTQSVIDRPLPLDEQECVKRDGYVWCADWWTIEVCKYLINGEPGYIGDPPPNRLKNNPIFSKDVIIEHGRCKVAMYELLKEKKDELPNNLFLCEVGRGIDIVLAKMVKDDWRITCYDSNEKVLERVKARFPIVNANVDNSGTWDPDVITEPTVVIANQTMLGEEKFNKLRSNANIFQIIDGRHDDGTES